MLKLKELTFQSVGRFVDSQTINFEKLGSLVQVDGVNNNTGGSSGAGKSTVFHALDFLFGISNKPTTVLKCRQAIEDVYVQGTFDYDGKLLIITRGKKLAIDLDGEVTTGSSKISEEKLDEIMAIPRDLFRKMLHKRQKEGGFFLQMTPKETNEFLMSCLNLGHFKKKIEIVDKKTAELLEKKTSIANSLDSARSALKATQDAITAFGPEPVRDMHQVVLLQLKAKMDAAQDAVNLVLLREKIGQDGIEKERPTLTTTPFDKSVILELRKQIQDTENQMSLIIQGERDRQNCVKDSLRELKKHRDSLQLIKDKGQKAHLERLRLAKEVSKIRAQLCPTCDQNWATDDAKQKEAELIEKIKALKLEVNAGFDASEHLPGIDDAILKSEFALKPVIPQGLTDADEKLRSLCAQRLIEDEKEENHQAIETARNNAILKEFADKQKKNAELFTQLKTQALGQLTIDTRAFEAAGGKLKAYSEAKARYDKNFASLKAQEASYAQKIAVLEGDNTKVTCELAKAEEIKKALKSFLSCSFDDALETISENSTKLIRSIPNMANATIQLEGIKETQDGKIKEEVNAVIHMDGEENVDIRSLCGGERTSTDLAIDLSVIDLIESRTNKGIDLFILDEPFEGLDTVCIEMALEVLKSSNTNKRLVIVDHNPIVKEQLGSGIVVERTGETSKVICHGQ